jgi:hypothetical protein
MSTSCTQKKIMSTTCTRTKIQCPYIIACIILVLDLQCVQVVPKKKLWVQIVHIPCPVPKKSVT